MERIHIMAAALLTAGLLAVTSCGASAQQSTPTPATAQPPAPASMARANNAMPRPESQTLPRNRTAQPPMPATTNMPAASNQTAQGNQGNADMNARHSAPDREPLTINGVRLPGNITFENWRMALNGGGVHTAWFFFDKYVAALYLSTPTDVAAAAIAGRGARAILLSMLTDMSQGDITNALHDAFLKSLPDNQNDSRMQQKWQQFASFFTDLGMQDTVLIVGIPDEGVSVRINGETHGPISGAHFARAIFGMWLGNSPIDGGLKKVMLGKRH